MFYDGVLVELPSILQRLDTSAKINLALSLRKSVEYAKEGSYEEAIKWAGIVEDWCWERLHSGHWKDVPVDYRRLYSLAVVLRADGLSRSSRCLEALGAVDKGLLLGAPVGNNLLQKMAEDLMEQVKIEQDSVSVEQSGGVSSCCLPSSEAHDTVKRKRSPMNLPLESESKKVPRVCDISEGGDNSAVSEGGDNSVVGEGGDNSAVGEGGDNSAVGEDNDVNEGSDHMPSHSLHYCPIERIECPSLERFYTEHMKPARPVILTGCMEHWPAMDERKWRSVKYSGTSPASVQWMYLIREVPLILEYLKKTAGARTVPIELGSRYTDDGWSQRLMTVNEFIEKHIQRDSATKGYLAQHALFEQIPMLQNDIIVPDYCCLKDTDAPSEGSDEDIKINAWFGPGGTVSPLHFDPQHNLLAQVVGRKYIVLFDVSYSSLLYSHGGILSNTSQVDVDNPDHSLYPLFKQAQGMQCVLNQGEILYIPRKWWHFVRSLSLSFSVSFWWN